jgi:cobalt-zinc-cadmium efflux system protein
VDHHGHEHHAAPSAPARKLWSALLLTAGFMVVEVVAGVLAHSLALLSDAGHMLTDAGALALALVAQRIAERPRTRLYTFGFRRAEILAALVNGAVLGVSAVWVIVEAVRRLHEPPQVHGAWMLAVATMGLAINLLAAWILSRGKESNANVRAALAHVVSDAAGSVAAMAAGVLVVGFGWLRADPVASIAISLLILWGAWRLVRGSMRTLMETTPPGIDLKELETTIAETPGVASVHDLHVWSISEGFPIVSVHVVLDGQNHGVDVVRAVGARLRERHAIEHATVQPEAPPSRDVVPEARLRRK